MPKILKTSRLILRAPKENDLEALKAFEKRNKRHLSPWESIKVPADVRIANWLKDSAEGRSVRFFIFAKDAPEKLVGMCNFTQIFRGAFQACYLGYKIDKDCEGQGYMFEALQRTIRYIFEEEKLHRIMAAYIPINVRSAALLDRLDFAVEGYARNYLLINDKWEDHILTALSHESWQKSHKEYKFRRKGAKVRKEFNKQ